MPAHTVLPADQDEALTTIQSDPNRTTGEDGRPSTRGIAFIRATYKRRRTGPSDPHMMHPRRLFIIIDDRDRHGKVCVRDDLSPFQIVGRGLVIIKLDSSTV